MDPHPLHNSIPPWAQQPPPPPPPPPAAAVPFSAVPYSHPNITHPREYAPHIQPLQNFYPAPPPPQTASPPAPVVSAVPAQSPAPAPAAAAPPSGGFQPGPMPSYAEMIHSAITVLNERDGSSKRAISKYMEKAYPGLPPAHPALLTQNLKRLKAHGLLVMNKKSYMLPGSGFPANIADLPDSSVAGAAPATAPPQPEIAANATATVTTQSVGPKRGRGRPPKPKPNLEALPNGQPKPAPGPLPDPVSQPMADAMPPGFATNGHQQPQVHFTGDINVAESNNNEAVNVPIELAEDASEIKRRPGRPAKKLHSVDAAGVVIGKRGRGRPPKNGLGLGTKKKSPGRPRKPKPRSVADVSGTNGYKRRPGRPRKNQTNSVLVPYALSEAAAAPSVSPRPRGRPRKGTGSKAAGVGVGGFSEKRSAVADDAVPEKRPRRSGRPVGRPRKYRDVSGTETGTETEAPGGFRRKLLFFQSRVGDVYSVLKPLLSPEAPSDVAEAVEELKKLANLDINQDLREGFTQQMNQEPEQDHMEETDPVES